MSCGCDVGAGVLDDRDRCVGVRSGCAMGAWVECEGVDECPVLEWWSFGLIMSVRWVGECAPVSGG